MTTPLLLIWADAQRSFPGLAHYILPDDPDSYISATLFRIRRGLEHNVELWIAEMWTETGRYRASTRRWLQQNIPRLRAARALNVRVLRAMAEQPAFAVAAE